MCAFLALNVHGIPNPSPSQSCSVNSVCGLLENVLEGQDRLEKKVDGRYAKGKIELIVDFAIFARTP